MILHPNNKLFLLLGCIEGQHAKQYGQLISLSEQQGLDCDYSDGGCSGGLPVNLMT